MADKSLKAVRRAAGKGAARHARRINQVPAIIYGSGIDPIAVAVDEVELGQLVRGGAQRHVFTLQIQGEQPRQVLIQDLQRDVIGDNILAVDFRQVNMQQRIRIRIPVHLSGEESVTARAQVAELHETEVEVECLPEFLPDSVYINVTDLHPGQHIAIRELPFLAGVCYVDDPDRIVVTVASPKIEQVPVAPPENSPPDSNG